MKLSIIIPAFNAARTVDACLKSIFAQIYPRKEFEVLFLEGYSSDATYEIAKKYPVRMLRNHLKNEDERRIYGLKKAKGRIICLIDTDNVLPEKDWLKKMMQPFEDKEIIFADTLYGTYRPHDRLCVKYNALIGDDDPFAMYLGLYSRWSYITNDWTGCPYQAEDQGTYLKARFLDANRIPAMGSNGFFIRKEVLTKYIKNSWIHSDIQWRLMHDGYNCFAKVKTAYIHDQRRFFRNKIRRIKRRLAHEVKFEYNYGITKKDIAKLALRLGLILPILYDTLKGFVRKPSIAWIFHPIACYGELAIHMYYRLRYGFSLT